MKYTYLGKSGLFVSRLCLGTMNFSEQIDEAAADRIMDKAYDLGINFWDTANCYGKIDGDNERYIGRWLKKHPDRRERLMIATKLYVNMPGDWELDVEGKSRGHLNGYRIRKHIEGSLRRLQTDYIDLIQMHHYDREANPVDIWNALSVAYQQGKICYCGTSNFGARDLLKMQEAAEKQNFLGIISEQTIYNLMTRWPEMEVLPTATDMGLGVMTWSPMNGGLLSGKALRKPDPDSRTYQSLQELTPAQYRQLEAYSKACWELGEKESHVAIAWLLSRSAVTCPIIGPRSAEQLDEIVQATEIHLPEDFLKRLDEIFPTMGNAPSCYCKW